MTRKPSKNARIVRGWKKQSWIRRIEVWEQARMIIQHPPVSAADTEGPSAISQNPSNSEHEQKRTWTAVHRRLHQKQK
jgi:hypothetical protein